MSAPPETQAAGTLRRVLAFAELRDAVLFLGTTVYVLGYLTWAVYSADQGLGVLPPLEGQYFLAGVVPLLLVIFAIAALWAIAPLSDPAARRTASLRGERVMIPSLAAILVPAGMSPWMMLPQPWSAGLLLAGCAGVYVSLALKVRSAEFGTGVMLWLFRMAVPLLVLSALLFNATRLFPLLSRELGGPRPLCVELDVVAASVSPATLADLGAVADSAIGAVRSAPLWLHFDGGGTLVLSRSRGRPVPSPFRLNDANVPAIRPSTRCAP
jgi:hypothetical protein